MNSPVQAALLLCSFGLLPLTETAWTAEQAMRYEFRLPQLAVFRLGPTPRVARASAGGPEWITGVAETVAPDAPLQPGAWDREASLVARAWSVPGPVLRAAPERPNQEVVEFGSRVVLQLADGARVDTAIAGRPLALARTIDIGLVILQAPDAVIAAAEATRLAQRSDVRVAYPVLRRPAALHGSYAAQPNDPCFVPLFGGNVAGQWYLENRDVTNGAALGVDLNVRAAWPNSEGKGITVAVADVGVEVTHPDLLARTAGAPHRNFNNGGTNALPLGTSASWSHGTAAASLVAAEGNNHYGMIGVAPRAQLASWLVFQTNLALVSDETLMDMYTFASNSVAVQSHSWGSEGVTQKGPTPLEQAGIAKAWRDGRGGRGVVMVRSGGNDRLLTANVNDDGYPSDPRVIAVAAVNRDGRVAGYSEPGACVLVAAPAGEAKGTGLFAADLTGPNGTMQFGFFPPYEYLWNYMFNSLGFSGTSAAAPLISGVAALVLAANTNLTSRDVQQILLLSARHFDLEDPDLGTNGAGFRVSHNVGFGVPDAAAAVRLARSWSNRPPPTILTLTATNRAAIPDDGLRLLITGDGVPAQLVSVRTVTSLGPHPDLPTATLPMVDVGLATNILTVNLAGKAALIERGTNQFAQKINFAALAGAAFAVIYNFATNAGGDGCPGGDQLCALGGTDFTPIPAVFIGHADGRLLANVLTTNTSARAQLRLLNTNYLFTVTNTLSCEHVGVRLQTDHPLRGDLRITLRSPQGTRSILQRYNSDTNAGPSDWTYYSTHHFFEGSAGVWTLAISDEYAGFTGSVQLASLILTGVEIVDADADGLDDPWELKHFGTLAYGPADDPDGDGYNNAREQVMGTDPIRADVPFQLDFSLWNQSLARLSWASTTNRLYEVWAGANPTGLAPLTNLVGRFPETEWFTGFTNLRSRFFQVRATPR